MCTPSRWLLYGSEQITPHEPMAVVLGQGFGIPTFQERSIKIRELASLYATCGAKQEVHRAH